MTLTKIFGLGFVMIGMLLGVITLALISTEIETRVITVISCIAYLIGSALMLISVWQDSRKPQRI